MANQHKEIIQWFPFHAIVEHNACIIVTDISLIPLLLKVFEMFQMRLFYYKIMKRRKKWSLYLLCVAVVI